LLTPVKAVAPVTPSVARDAVAAADRPLADRDRVGAGVAGDGQQPGGGVEGGGDGWDETIFKQFQAQSRAGGGRPAARGARGAGQAEDHRQHLDWLGEIGPRMANAEM